MYLTVIALCGSEKDTDFEFLIKTVLSDTFRVTYVGNGKIEQWGKGYELLAADFADYRSVRAEDPIFLMKKDCVPKFPLPENARAIACSENEEQILALKSCGRVITCGFGKTDSFSYSSLSESGLVVTLNRELTAFSGKKIQPLELPLELPKGVDPYSMIAFTALRVLLDDFNSEIGKLI